MLVTWEVPCYGNTLKQDKSITFKKYANWLTNSFSKELSTGGETLHMQKR